MWSEQQNPDSPEDEADQEHDEGVDHSLELTPLSRTRDGLGKDVLPG